MNRAQIPFLLLHFSKQVLQILFNFSYQAFSRITTDETKYRLKENLIGGAKPHFFLKSGVKEENEGGNNNQN